MKHINPSAMLSLNMLFITFEYCFYYVSMQTERIGSPEYIFCVCLLGVRVGVSCSIGVAFHACNEREIKYIFSNLKMTHFIYIHF